MLQIIRDYETPPQKEFSRGLEAELQPSVAFLDRCRPLSVSMTNALRHLTWQLTQLPNSVSDSEVTLYLYVRVVGGGGGGVGVGDGGSTVKFIGFTTRETSHPYLW
jgi:hypothetical protein